MKDVEGWEEKKLIDLADYINGYAFKPDDWGKDGLPIIRIEQLKNPNALKDYFSGSIPKKQIIEDGDLIFSWSASLFLSIWKHGSAALNQHLFKVVEKEGVDRVFLKLFIEFYLPELTKASHGSTMQHITRKELERFDAPFPTSKPEQTKIAEVLSTVDQAIEQTEVLIAKQQRIKTGLMQDLLTRGIDEHGNLRSEQTHEFKDSPLGRIPVEWTDKTLSEVYAEIPKNGIFKTAKEIGMGSLMIGQTSFTSDRRINYKNSRRAHVSISELMSYKLQENDILVTRVYATVDGVGLPVLVEKIPEPAVYESNMLRLRVDTNQILPNYTFYWLMSAPIRTFIVASVNASNQTSINQQVMNSIPIIFPKKTEQETIVSILAKSEKSIEGSTSSLRKLLSLKTGLMQELLTGKKRVTALLNDTEVVHG
jgi:type I restriction enzyme S subunit